LEEIFAPPTPQLPFFTDIAEDLWAWTLAKSVIENCGGKII